MKTSELIVKAVIGLLILWVLSIILSHLGFRTGLLLFSPHLVFWLSLLIIHIASAAALFKEIKARHSRRIPTYLSLDALFWALVGLTFGLIGLLAHWFFNDYLRSHGYLDQPESSGNSVETTAS